jgi:hypothetical protein
MGLIDRILGPKRELRPHPRPPTSDRDARIVSPDGW